MIRINLLPPEMRRTEHTPPARRLTIFIGTALVMAAVAATAWVYMQIKQLDAEIASLEEAKRQAEAKVKDYEAVKAERTTYLARKDAVESIKAKRKFRWSKQLDTLADVVEVTPRLWLSSIKFADGSPTTGLRLPASLATKSVEYYLEMRDSRTATADKTLYREVERVITERMINSGQFGYLVPAATISMEKQEKYVEQFSHKFNLMLLGLGAAKPAAGPGAMPGGT